MKKEDASLLIYNCLKERSEVRVVKRGININQFLNLFIFLILILLINISFISAQKYQLKVTEEHPFFVNDEWIPAKELKVGDNLLTVGEKKAKITSIKEIIDDVEVYNLEAKPFNDFVVDGNVIVHNSNNPYSDVSMKPISEVLSMTPEQKIAEAERVFKKDFPLGLDPTRKDAILRADEQENIFAKIKILLETREDGTRLFTDAQIRELLNRGITGKSKLPCFTCTNAPIKDKIRATLLKRLGKSVQKSRFMKGYLDVTETIFIYSQGKTVSLTERPDIIFDNIMNNRVGVGTNPGAEGIWNGVGTKVKNLGNIIIDKADIDTTAINNPGAELAQQAALWNLFERSVGINYRYNAKTDTITWPANIKIRSLSPDGRILDLSMEDPLQLMLRTWDDFKRIDAMYNALRGFTVFNDYPIISPVTEEYVCYLRGERGYRNVISPREVARSLDNRLFYIGEADRLFFFLQHPNLNPILRIYFVEVSGTNIGLGDRLENRRCALDFFRLLFDQNRIDINPRDVGF